MTALDQILATGPTETVPSLQGEGVANPKRHPLTTRGRSARFRSDNR